MRRCWARPTPPAPSSARLKVPSFPVAYQNLAWRMAVPSIKPVWQRTARYLVPPSGDALWLTDQNKGGQMEGTRKPASPKPSFMKGCLRYCPPFTSTSSLLAILMPAHLQDIPS